MSGEHAEDPAGYTIHTLETSRSTTSQRTLMLPYIWGIDPARLDRTEVIDPLFDMRKWTYWHDAERVYCLVGSHILIVVSQLLRAMSGIHFTLSLI